MTKRLTEKQKEDMKVSFTNGKTVEFLSKEFNCTKLTIIRNLKKNIGELEFKQILNKNKIRKDKRFLKDINNLNVEKSDPDLGVFNKKSNEIKDSNDHQNEVHLSPSATFVEIKPLDYEIEDLTRKDLSSVPISEINFPEVVYMIVGKQVELEIKLLKDYPQWGFLSNDDLNRKTIEIHYDIKSARRLCNKEQKVIKVPNTDVFRIVSPVLRSKGISRIVGFDKLIAI